MNKALVVAKWEYLEKVKSKAFLIGLFLMPVIMVAMGVLPTIFAGQEDRETRVIGVIDLSGEFFGSFATRMQTQYTLSNGQPNYVIKPIAAGKGINLGEAVAEADEQVIRDEIEGYCIISADMFSDSVIDYRSKNVGDFRISYRIEETLRHIMTEKRLVSMGLDPALLKQIEMPLRIRTVKLSRTGEKEDSGFMRVFFTSYIFLMMLFFLILTSGQLLVRSVIEEKSNRIVEVLVSSCSPTELMAGKVLGLSGLGFTQIGFWTIIGVAASLQFGVNFVPPDHALLLILYFILGYLFYAAVFIGVGSPVTTEQEAQQITSYLVPILILPIVLAIPAMQNPGGLWLKILSFVPLLTPTIMALRIPIETPPAWEILATVLLMVLSIYFAMVVAGRIFRVAILATGKRPSLKEIVAWVRTG